MMVIGETTAEIGARRGIEAAIETVKKIKKEILIKGVKWIGMVNVRKSEIEEIEMTDMRMLTRKIGVKRTKIKIGEMTTRGLERDPGAALGLSPTVNGERTEAKVMIVTELEIKIRIGREIDMMIGMRGRMIEMEGKGTEGETEKMIGMGEIKRELKVTGTLTEMGGIESRLEERKKGIEMQEEMKRTVTEPPIGVITEIETDGGSIRILRQNNNSIITDVSYIYEIY